MMCQTCIDNGQIAKWLADIIDAHEDRYDDGYGEGAHIVIGDWNVEDGHICYCLSQTEMPMRHETRRFLWWMLTIPEKERVPNPREEY
jgi:hypothetical protein